MTTSNPLPSILIVDDQEFVFRIVQATLRSQGVQLASAKSGTQALHHIEKIGVPDAIILDFSLPDMDGVETLRRIRSLPTGKTIPVLMLTSRDQTLIRNDAEGLNVYDFMTKPFGPNSLVQTVKEMLHPGQATQRGNDTQVP